MNNKYKLEAPDFPEADISDEKSRKRKRGSDRPCNLHGKYDLRKDYLSKTCFSKFFFVKLQNDFALFGTSRTHEPSLVPRGKAKKTRVL